VSPQLTKLLFRIKWQGKWGKKNKKGGYQEWWKNALNNGGGSLVHGNKERNQEGYQM